MSGALPYVNNEASVAATLDNFELWLSGYFQLDEVRWRVAFNEFGVIATDGTNSDLLDLSVIGRISEPIPEIYADDSGKIPGPIFPIGLDRMSRPREIDPEESEGQEQVLTRSVVELREVGDLSCSSDGVLDDIIERHSDHGIVDAFGTAWSERDSLLAADTAERSLTNNEPNVVVSFDVLRTLIYPFQYENYLKYDKHDDGKLVREDRVSFEKIIKGEPVSWEDLPEVDKIYLHQDRRVSASDYQVSAQDIAEAIQGRVVGWSDACTVTDPSERGLRARIGAVVKLDVEEDEEMYNGYVRVSSDADVSLVHDFYAALSVPEAPFLTHELAQETVDWEEDHFYGWSARENGFAYHSLDERREIRRRLMANKYWVIHGENYRRKRDFEEDVEVLIDLIESNIGCDASWRDFNGVRVSKTPISQSDVLEQIQEEVRAPPSRDDLIEAIGPFSRRSQDIEGIDEPLFPSDLSAFVADTSIIDAQTITRMVAEGGLYDSTVVIPDVVFEEIHRQVEQDTSRGERGLEELTALRELAEADIIEIDVVECSGVVDTEDNVAVDQALIKIARNIGIPLCSADSDLMKFAEAAGVKAYPLNQELSRWSQIIVNSLKTRGEIQIPELLRIVYLEIKESQISEESLQREMVRTPGQAPSEDVATEMGIRDEIEQLERRGRIYIEDDRVGLRKEVAIVPSLTAIENGLVSEKIKSDDFIETVKLPSYQVQFRIFLPDTFDHWASLQPTREYLDELQELEELENSNKIQIEWKDILPSEIGIVLVEEEQFSNLMHGLQRKVAAEYAHTSAIDSTSGSLMLNY